MACRSAARKPSASSPPAPSGMPSRTSSTSSATTKPEIVIEDSGVIALDPRDDAAIAASMPRQPRSSSPCRTASTCPSSPPSACSPRKLDARHPILLKDTLHPRPPGPDTDFLDTLLTAATNIGSLLCDGIGDAILVQGEAGARPVAAPRLQHPASRRHAHFQDRLRRLPELRPHALQPADHHRRKSAPPPAISKA